MGQRVFTEPILKELFQVFNDRFGGCMVASSSSAPPLWGLWHPPQESQAAKDYLTTAEVLTNPIEAANRFFSGLKPILKSAGHIRFSNELPARYFEELTSERHVTFYKFGQPRKRWERVKGMRAEGLDATVYAMAVRNIVGVDLTRLIDRAEETLDACRIVDDNPGLALGLALGTGWEEGRDKVIPTSNTYRFGLWVEQLLAESTGKNGKALIPLEGETLGKPEVYGNDRVFIDLRLKSDTAPDREAVVRPSR